MACALLSLPGEREERPVTSMARIKPMSRMTVIHGPIAAVRWDLCLLALLALVGVLASPPRS